MDKNITIQDFHKKIAIENFNKTWDLIEKTTRTAEDDAEMIRMAITSRYHWGEIGNVLNFARGEWQISRVYSLLNRGEEALYYAKRSLDYYLKNNIKVFDLAFEYEAVARAYMVLNNKEKMNKFVNKAKEACDHIQKDDDKEYTLSEIETIK